MVSEHLKHKCSETISMVRLHHRIGRLHIWGFIKKNPQTLMSVHDNAQISLDTKKYKVSFGSTIWAVVKRTNEAVKPNGVEVTTSCSRAQPWRPCWSSRGLGAVKPQRRARLHGASRAKPQWVRPPLGQQTTVQSSVVRWRQRPIPSAV